MSTYKSDHKSAAVKPKEIQNLIPDKISECVICLEPGQPCSDKQTVFDIRDALKLREEDPSTIIEKAKMVLGCDTEKCVLEKLATKLGHQRVSSIIQNNIKPCGPRDDKLLSNVCIDGVLRQWGAHFPEFFPYYFNMLNYAQYSFSNGETVEHPDTLATINFRDLYSGKHDGKQYQCAACVINSDVYQGKGKHWMALFVDVRGPIATVEFFNSSGNSPVPEWINWMVKTKSEIESAMSKQVEIIKSSNIRHQQSKTECGVYSLFYIYARINKISPDFFRKTPIPDQIMFEFRQHLFYDQSIPQFDKFDWGSYNRHVNVKWE